MADPRGVRIRADWDRAVRELFDRAGLSYHVLAERTGIAASTLQQMVTGRSFPRAATVRLFARACGEADEQAWVDARARVAAGDVTVSRPRTAPGQQVRIGAVPQAAGSFQDRELAARLEEAAGADGTVVLTQVLAGMGGTGKTQLAAAYARHSWREGAGLVAWVNAASRDAVVAAYADAAGALGLPSANPEDPQRSAQALLAWAETVTSCWWLVILDDVQQPGDISGLWPPAAESAAWGQVVVTTRLREAALAGPGRRMIEVPVFTMREACEYLRGVLGERAPGEEAGALAGTLGMLPLALSQAAAYIRNADITIGRYLDLLGARLLRDVVPEPGHLTDDHQLAVNATWELSVEQADKARPTGLARPLLQLASVLDPAGIPQQVLSSPPALAYLSAELAKGDAGRGTAAGEEMVDEGLRVLHRYSLIDHDRGSRYREVRVHQLVQRATRENLTTQPGQPGPDPLSALATAAADALIAVWP
jgi:transcriptional regulator with XRE-family HTH domain